ncbi:hypothetical protein [Thioclava sp. DLFJ4-1]|uniref:hypothetical protein n=1 Tax=Thioclava sp. DLFJ4-1 TaxID=1915313 RepID=UPI000998861D|nr:hypothetical protein [Thioclava sp. DLFJ4-1]OOY15096.1 hypothetical protein BMI85_16245 [Thioclava sp. DLFJ4-1]
MTFDSFYENATVDFEFDSTVQELNDSDCSVTACSDQCGFKIDGATILGKWFSSEDLIEWLGSQQIDQWSIEAETHWQDHAARDAYDRDVESLAEFRAA